MRATMSLPGIFAPVHDGKRVYVDGGLVGNLPTDVVRQMGADVVIGVHLESAPANADTIRSLFQVLGRSIDVVIRDNEIRGLAGADLIVKVELQDFDSMQYEKFSSIIDRGTQAAEQKAHVLAPPSTILAGRTTCGSATRGRFPPWQCRSLSESKGQTRVRKRVSSGSCSRWSGNPLIRK
jgi:predicted acylesterase/phospholipase RssA